MNFGKRYRYVANDYTAITNVKNHAITWEELFEADYTFNQPFDLHIDNNAIFYAEKVLRIVPTKRLVVYGKWNDKPAVAKLFFDKHQAQQRVEREIKGIAILQNNKIPTPSILHHGIADERIEVLISEYIPDAKNLETIWEETKNPEIPPQELYNAMVELATHHVLGVIQHDLHLGNFLITEKMTYTLDGACIIQDKQLLPKKASINNVALFLSQLGIGCEVVQEKLFKHYAKSRGWLIKRDDIDEVFSQIKNWNTIRWSAYSKKIFRSSTGFTSFNKNGFYGVFNRAYINEEFSEILENPDSAFTHPTAVILKNGRSATVVKITINQREIIVKRHNMKHVFHQLRRYVRTTRALKVWRLANKLNLFAIPVAKPIGFLEKRFMGLHSRSYYFSECLEGVALGDFVRQYRHDEVRIANVAAKITTLLKNITKLKIAHGDLKETNILLTKNDDPILIDFDAAAEHSSVTRLKQAWKRDINRLLKNFHNEPIVAKKFKEALI